MFYLIFLTKIIFLHTADVRIKSFNILKWLNFFQEKKKEKEKKVASITFPDL